MFNNFWFFQKIVEIFDKYGIKKACKIFVLIIIFFFIDAAVNKIMLPSVINTYNTTTTESHEMGTEQRAKADPLIQQTLLENIVKLKCDRSYVMEMHNGVSNPTGLPFRYCEMTYEQTSTECDDVRDEWDKVNMSRYPIFSYLMEKGIFAGNIKELYNIDKRMSKRMEMNNVKYLIMRMMTANGVPIGVIGVSYCNKPNLSSSEKMNVLSQITTSGDKITVLLNEQKANEISSWPIFNF